MFIQYVQNRNQEINLDIWIIMDISDSETYSTVCDDDYWMFSFFCMFLIINDTCDNKYLGFWHNLYPFLNYKRTWDHICLWVRVIFCSLRFWWRMQYNNNNASNTAIYTRVERLKIIMINLRGFLTIYCPLYRTASNYVIMLEFSSKVLRYWIQLVSNRLRMSLGQQVPPYRNLSSKSQ